MARNKKKEKTMPRRDFVKSAAAGVAGLAAASIPASSYARILGANDRVRVGIVGFSDRFRQALLPAFKAAGPTLNFEIVAVSDIWNRRRDEGVAEIERVMGAKPRAFLNNEEMYAAKVVDAVMISTPDFLHDYHGVEAIHAGKDAYIEKPLAHSMDQAVAIRDAVKKSDRVVQIGTQRRSAANYQAANEFIRSGKFGDIVMAEMTWNVNQPGRWRRPQLVASIQETDTDWKRFLAYMPFEAWDPRKYLEYRLFWPYSSGIPDQWMVHRVPAPAERRRQRRRLPLEGRAQELGHRHYRVRVRAARRSHQGLSGRVRVAHDERRGRHQGAVLFERRDAEPRYQRDFARRWAHRALCRGNGHEGQPTAHDEAVRGGADGDRGEHRRRFVHHRERAQLDGVRALARQDQREHRRRVQSRRRAVHDRRGDA